MTTETFHQQFDEYIPDIQRLASRLTTDFDLARFLYLETAHQAFKHKNDLQQETLKSWLVQTMKRTYSKLLQKNKHIKQLQIAA